MNEAGYALESPRPSALPDETVFKTGGFPDD
jgi:hypothetical protein